MPGLIMVSAPDGASYASTPRLCLRPVNPERDAEDILRTRCSPQVSEYIHPKNAPVPTLSTVKQALYARSATNQFFLALTLRSSPAFPPSIPEPLHTHPLPWAAHPPPSSSPASYIDRDDQTVIGTIGITAQHELGFVIDEPWWGMGLATEAVTAAIKAWEEIQGAVALAKGVELRAAVNSANVGSVRVLQKVGFVKKESKEVEDWDRLGGKVRLEVWGWKRG